VTTQNQKRTKAHSSWSIVESPIRARFSDRALLYLYWLKQVKDRTFRCRGVLPDLRNTLPRNRPDKKWRLVAVTGVKWGAIGEQNACSYLRNPGSTGILSPDSRKDYWPPKPCARVRVPAWAPIENAESASDSRLLQSQGSSAKVHDAGRAASKR